MKFKTTKKFIAIGLVLVALTGCSSGTKTQMDELSYKLTQIEEENKNLEANVQALEAQIDQLTNENNSLLLEIESLTKLDYPIYTRDVDSWEIIEVEKAKIDKNLPVIEKLQVLAEKLSNSQFEGYPIEIKEVKNIKGNEIAIINLKDKSNKHEETWFGNYFQGSAGAEITKTAIEETLLQRKNQDQWIDGIQILYNGEELMSDHMTLGSIIYRNK